MKTTTRHGAESTLCSLQRVLVVLAVLAAGTTSPATAEASPAALWDAIIDMMIYGADSDNSQNVTEIEALSAFQILATAINGLAIDTAKWQVRTLTSFSGTCSGTNIGELALVNGQLVNCVGSIGAYDWVLTSSAPRVGATVGCSASVCDEGTLDEGGTWTAFHLLGWAGGGAACEDVSTTESAAQCIDGNQYKLCVTTGSCSPALAPTNPGHGIESSGPDCFRMGLCGEDGYNQGEYAGYSTTDANDYSYGCAVEFDSGSQWAGACQSEWAVGNCAALCTGSPDDTPSSDAAVCTSSGGTWCNGSCLTVDNTSDNSAAYDQGFAKGQSNTTPGSMCFNAGETTGKLIGYSDGQATTTPGSACYNAGYATGVQAGIACALGDLSGELIGLTNVGSGSTSDYSVTELSGATSYTWTVPNEATLTAGQGTATATILFGAQSSVDICVAATNDCDITPPICTTVTVSP